MPELPEVETTLRGIAPHVQGARIRQFVLREPRLRWPVPPDLEESLPGRTIQGLTRRGKYLLLDCGDGNLLLHLGMSGSLRIVAPGDPPRKHDHLDFVLDNDKVLRFHDPRRFGCLLWQPGDPLSHPLLRELGPEPLSESFSGDYLYRRSRRSTTAVKTFLMDSRQVVGVGNIYANEALFLAGINPRRKAGAIGRERYQRLADAVREVLNEAIRAGGTTLRDFVGGDGKPGYFSQSLRVYGRGGHPCLNCGNMLKEVRQSQRATVYCSKCQR